MKKVVAFGAALLMTATMAVSAFAAGSVTGVVEVSSSAQEVEATYVEADGTVQTGTVQVVVTENQEAAASKEEVEQIEAVSGEGYTCVNVLDVKTVVQKDNTTREVTTTQPVNVELNVSVAEDAAIDEVVVTAYNTETGKWEKLPARAVSYDRATGKLVFSLDAKYSKVAVAVAYAQPQQPVSRWERFWSRISGR